MYYYILLLNSMYIITKTVTYLIVLEYLQYAKYDSIGCILHFFTSFGLLKRKMNSQSPVSGVEFLNNRFLAKNIVLSNSILNGKCITSEVKI